MKQIERNFIIQTCQDIEKLNGTEFEVDFCKNILELILGLDVQNKGHNLYAKPVRGSSDFNTNNFEIVGQSGTDNKYFSNLEKPIADINSAINNHPNSKTIYLFANQRATGNQLSQLNDKIKLENYSQNIEIYDSEKIAKKVILDNILNEKIESVLENCTPIAYQLYISLPQTNKLPKSTSKKYFERESEKKIIEKLDKEKIVQLYGVSGIGKTEVSKSIAQKLQNNYETIIWVNCDDIKNSNLNFASIHISKFNTNINLESLLQNHKLLLILDNFNENLNYIKKQFEGLNKKNSVCLITSLQKNLSTECSHELSYLSNETSKDILCETRTPPSDEIAKGIIEYVNGYPLVLNIIRDSVERNDYTWDYILNDLKNIIKIEDQEKNIKIATRILEKSSQQINEELKWLFVLNNRFLSKEFLEYVLNKIGINSLKKRSILVQTETAYYTVHQIILDAIQYIYNTKKTKNNFLYEKLENYLKFENEKKSVGYFNFLFNHDYFIDSIYNQLNYTDPLKQQILYAKIQARDIEKGNWFLNEIKNYSFNYNTKIEILLLIEKTEIELFNAKIEFKKTNKEEYFLVCKSKIEILEELLGKSSITNIGLYLNHHLGKIYTRIENYIKAIELFEGVIQKDNNADYSRLQIARIAAWYDDRIISSKNLEILIDEILDNTTNWKEKSLSVLLATYELISENKMKELRKKHIDDRINDFIKILFYSLSFGFEQPFELLSKLSYHLSYNKQNEYCEICENLPFPTTIEENDKVKFSFATIQVAYYKLLKYSSYSDKESKMNTAFNLAIKYYKAIDLNDFQRAKFVDLYIEAKEYNEALKEVEKYSNKETDPFYFQKLCKIYRNLDVKDNIETALKNIQKAIDMASTGSKFARFISAFLHDKAETIHIKSPHKSIEILNEAISKEKNKRTIDSWKMKLEKWKNDL